MADKLEPQKVLEAIENCSVEDQQIVLQYAYETIKQLMTDAVPVVHGHWIQLFGEWIEESLVGRVNRCSVCGRNIITNGIDKTGKALVATVNNPFCRWCGAKMDEDGEQK